MGADELAACWRCVTDSFGTQKIFKREAIDGIDRQKMYADGPLTTSLSIAVLRAWYLYKSVPMYS